METIKYPSRDITIRLKVQSTQAISDNKIYKTEEYSKDIEKITKIIKIVYNF